MTVATTPPYADLSSAPEDNTLNTETRTRLGEAGYAVVPRRPTPRMVEAGRLAGNGDPAMAAAIFAAMTDAAD
jgi:hypothetical protein